MKNGGATEPTDGVAPALSVNSQFYLVKKAELLKRSQPVAQWQVEVKGAKRVKKQVCFHGRSVNFSS